jgi:hypothetical protein
MHTNIVKRLYDSLKWFIENDETNNIPENKCWLDGLHEAKNVVSEYDTSSRIVVFVDGEIYNGHAVFDCYKGFGWPDGRAAAIQIEAPRWSEVYIMDMTFGKLRKCIYREPENKDFAKIAWWDVEDIPDDDS